MPSLPRPRRARVHPVSPPAVTAWPFPSRADLPLPLVERYLALRSTRLSERTIIAYRREITAYAPEVGGDAAVLAVTPEALALWFRARLREPGQPDDSRRWSLRTAHRKRVTLGTFYEWLRRAGLVVRNPVADLDLPRSERPRPVVVSADAIDRLFAHVEARVAELTPTEPRRAALYPLDAALLRLMDRLALRVSEASHIRMAAVTDGERPDGGSEVRVWVHKKGNKPREYPLSGVVLTAYLRWLYLRKEVTARPRHEDYLFIHPWTGYRVSRQRAWHRLKRLAREAGLPHAVRKVISPHKLRHSSARRMLDEGGISPPSRLCSTTRTSPPLRSTLRTTSRPASAPSAPSATDRPRRPLTRRRRHRLVPSPTTPPPRRESRIASPLRLLCVIRNSRLPVGGAA